MEKFTANPTHELLQPVTEVIAAFLLGLKNLGLYAEEHDICQRSLRKVFDRLNAFLDRAGTLRLDIDRDRILYQTETVFQDPENDKRIAFFLFRDGIKWIEFKKGLGPGELKGFLKIINRHRSIQENPEGDLATALWDANFPNILYRASDIYWESETSTDLQFLNSGEPADALQDGPEEEDTGTPGKAILSTESGLCTLTPEETAKLRQMILAEEKRDGTLDLFELAWFFMSDQTHQDLLDGLLRYVRSDIVAALSQNRFRSACKSLSLVHKSRLKAQTEAPWAAAYFTRLIRSVSDPKYLKAFAVSLRTLDKTDKDLVELIWQFLKMLHSDALEALVPVLPQLRSVKLQKRFMQTLVNMASKDPALLERLMDGQDESAVQRLVCIAERIPGNETLRLLKKMSASSSPRVRRQAIKSLLARDPLLLETVFHFIEDPNRDVRRTIFDHLARKPSRIGETHLLGYLQKGRFVLKDKEHLLRCYRTLGKCGSSQSVPYLRTLLFKGRWRQIFHGYVHRQGAVAALMELESKEAETVLAQASRSILPTVRMAYRRGSETSRA